MQRSKYPKFVCKNAIERVEDYENDRCYKLAFPISRRGKKNVLVISRAPKPCDDSYCNRMIQLILKYIDAKKDELGSIFKVTLVNLFTVLEYDTATIEKVYEEKGESFITGNDNLFYYDDKPIQNDSIIQEAIQGADIIILAWGEALKAIEGIYNFRVEQILKVLRDTNNLGEAAKDIYIVGDLTKKGYPRHCLCWTKKDDLLRLEW